MKREIDLTQDEDDHYYGTDIEHISSSSMASPSTPRKQQRTRRGVSPEAMPENLKQIPETSLLRRRADGDFDEIKLTKGTCVEISPDATVVGATSALGQGYFLRIKRIFANYECQYLRGDLFKRARYGYGIFDKTAGEVFWLNGKTYSINAQAIVRVRELVLTNHTDLTCGGIFSRDDAWAGEDTGRLICRHRAYIADERNVTVASAKHVLGESGYIRMLHESETDQNFGFPAKEMKKEWMLARQQHIEAESREIRDKAIDLTATTQRISRETVTLRDDIRADSDIHGPDITEITGETPLRNATSQPRVQAQLQQKPTSSEIPRHIQHKRKYTFGDFFCGCGGASLGASLAGLQINYGVDKCKEAIETYAENFGSRKAIYADICDFASRNTDLNLPASKLYADVIHLSCPCQFFSPVHTRPGKEDEMNESASLVINNIIEILQPRVVTLEQTFGLGHTEKFRDHFTTVVNQLVRHNYSVRWSEIDGTKHGTYSPRRRLIMIASCPGEFPPEFPLQSTYNPLGKRGGPNPEPNYGNLPQTPTAGQLLARIPWNAENHVQKPYPQPRISPFRLDRPLDKTITCDGGNKVHPDGIRPFTVRELAVFQTFPIDFKFSRSADSKITKQIGNAWPPEFAKKIYEVIVKHLERMDNTDRDSVIHIN